MVNRRKSINVSECVPNEPEHRHNHNGCSTEQCIPENANLLNYQNGSPTAAKTNGFLVTRRLKTISEMPTYLQFNRYIIRGYRPLSSTWECTKSMFTLNNETLNILTHGIPLVYIIINARELLPWDEIKVSYLPYCHIGAITSSWIGSVIYHLFMNHKTGENTYNRLLNLDMLGIWFTESFGALTTIYASIYCLPISVHYFIFSFYSLLSAVALYKALIADSPWERRCSFALQVGLRAALLALRISPYGGGDPDSMMHVLFQDLLAIIGAVIGAVRIPERWYPGNMDYVGNSHHLMHILVVMAVVHMHKAAKLDLLWISSGQHQCQPITTT